MSDDTTFSVGDKVVCVNKDNIGVLEKGKTYTVKNIRPDGEIAVGTNPDGWYAHRFKKVEEKVMPEYNKPQKLTIKDFKVGDKVICIDGTYPKDKILTVLNITTDCIHVPPRNPASGKDAEGWYPLRFKKVEEAQSKKAPEVVLPVPAARLTAYAKNRSNPNEQGTGIVAKFPEPIVIDYSMWRTEYENLPE